MASRDIYILTSSPPAPFTTYNMLSSPTLPSPSAIFKKKVPILRTGSRAVPIPPNATASFTSAATLLKADISLGVDVIRSYRVGAGEDDSLESKKTKKPAKVKPTKVTANKCDRVEDGKVVKKPRKSATKDDDASDVKKTVKPRAKKLDGELGDHGVVKEKAPRKSRAKKVGGEAIIDDVPKAKATRKPRAKKAEVDTQMRLSNAQITKPSVKSKSEKGGATKSKKLDIMTDADPLEGSLDYGLVEAVKRRSNWTPPPTTAMTASLATHTSVELDGELGSDRPKTSEERAKGFKDLFGSFGFSNIGDNATEKALLDGAGTRKRKHIELVMTNVSASNVISLPKAKAPKKKARTITDQATSAYAEDNEELAKPAPLLQYFSLQTTDSDGFKIPPKPHSKSPVKRRSKSGKGSAEAPILLSPESALKQVGHQDFVFGTSSQLAREESPTLLRDLHAAMQASNEIDEDDPFVDSALVQLPGRGNALSFMKRNLWSAASRDITGQLMEIETVDLVDSPAVARHFHSSAAHKDALSEAKEPVSDGWLDVEMEDDSNQKGTVKNKLQPVGPIEAAIRLDLLSSPASSMKPPQSPAKTPTKPKPVSPKVVKPSAKIASQSEEPKNLKKPDFGAYSTAQLVKEIASYRFKPVKSRDQMIILLEKCWEGKRRMALGNLAPNLPVLSPKRASKLLKEAPSSSQAQVSSPKKQRGRPRKESTATSPPKLKKKSKSKIATLGSLELDGDAKAQTPKKSQNKTKPVDEISDSDTPLTPSPPRRHPSQIGTPPLPLQLSSFTTVEDTPELSPASSQLRLFKHITMAVKSCPPSKDPVHPSWHEKILLYDPIILEDLTVWLNTGALEKVGWDGEVHPQEVKRWCDNKSICRLWKENLRGETRSRY